MVGKIYINGQIGANKDEVGINLIDVIRQVQSQVLATSFDVHINSQGGYVDVGFEIYDYLKSLNKPITTIGIELVASIATVIFMAGDVRKMKAGTQFMIHLPSGYAEGTAEEIAWYSDELKTVEDNLVKFYTSKTTLTAEAIRPLLKVETWLNADDAFKLGFITETEIIYKAVAKYEKLNIKTEIQMTNEDKGWIEEQFTKFTALFGTKAKAIMLLDSTGVEVDFPKVADGATPAVGDEATVDGKPAEGEYIMPQLDNTVIVCVAGIVTEITVAGGEDDTEMEALKAENEALKLQLSEATATSETATAKIEEIATQFTNFKAQVTAKFEDKKEPRKAIESGTSSAQERLNKLKKNK